MKRLNSAETTAAILKAVNEIKAQTNTAKPTKVAVSSILAKHKVSGSALPVMKELGILGYFKELGTSFYQWKYGTSPVDEKLANRVYDGVKDIQNQQAGKKRAAKKAETNHSVPKQNITTTQKSPGRPAGTPNKVKPTEFTHQSYGVKIEGDKLYLTKRTANQAGNDAETDLYQLVKKAKPVNERFVAPENCGTIFGYKQLNYLKYAIRTTPTKVYFNEYTIIENVKLIKYHVDQSKLSVTFHSESDLEVSDITKVAEVQLNNTVLGFKEHGGDSKELILMLTPIPVKDPWNIL